MPSISATDSPNVEKLVTLLIPLSPPSRTSDAFLKLSLEMIRRKSGFMTSSEEHMMATLTSAVDQMAAYDPDSRGLR